jgi:arylformamidase
VPTALTTIEREYSPSTKVDSLPRLLDEYRRRSVDARARLSPTTHPYGIPPCETVDVFPAGPGAPAHVFIHGGYWQELGKADSLFPAPGFVEAGITYVAVDYGLAPRFSLDEIVAQTRRAVAWVCANHATLDIDPERIVVSGSSAGAHLAVMAACTDWTAMGLPARAVSGLVLLSGIYDLEPLIGTYINDALRLDRADARRNSPLQQPMSPRIATPTIVAWAEHETDAFKRQSRRFSERWSAAGNPVVRLEVEGRNHFDVVFDLSDRDSPLGTMVHAMSTTR